MGAIKFPHTSGNSMSIAAPATNPASDLELKLPATVGTANQVLKNSSTAGTLEFGSAGKILQVKDASYSTSVATQNAAMVDTGLSCQIDNVASGSRILIIVNQAMRQYRDRNSTNKMGFGLDVVRTPS